MNTTVKPLNNRHIGTDLSIMERLSSFNGNNVLPLLYTTLCMLVHWKVSFVLSIQRCPLLKVSFIRG